MNTTDLTVELLPEKFDAGSLGMGNFAATLTIEHEGKKHKMDVIHDFGGSIFLQSKTTGRMFRLSLEWFAEKAIELGILDKNKTFDRKD